MHTEVEKETIVSFCWGHPLLGLHLSEICVGDNDNAYAHLSASASFLLFLAMACFLLQTATNAKEEEENILLMASF